MLPRHPHPWKILLIDDNVANLKVAVEHLQAYSFMILTALDGETGLQRAELTQPHLILLDVNLPGIDGIETCRRLKANPRTTAIPVIVMTVLSDTADKVRGLEAGAVDYVTKPFETVELLARVRTHIALHAFQRDLETLVTERTAALKAEIEQHRQTQEEKDLLLLTLRQMLETALVREQHDHALSTELATLEQINTCLLAIQHDVAPDMLGVSAYKLTLARELLDTLIQRATLRYDLSADEQDNPLQRLTTREQEVVRLIVDGKTSAEIADLLAIERGTVSTYRKRIMQKLEVNDLAGLIKLMFRYRA